MERLGIIEDIEHSDDSLRASKNEAEFVSPRPNAGETSEVESQGGSAQGMDDLFTA